MKHAELIDLLKDADTIEAAFSKLKGERLRILPINVDLRLEVFEAKRDYVILKTIDGESIYLHPIGARVKYSVSE